MKGLLSTEGLEQAVSNLYEECSPLKLNQFHSLMRDYRDILIAVRDEKKGYEEAKEAFFDKVSRLPIEITTLQDASKWFKLTGDLSEYKDCAIFCINMQKSHTRDRFVISNPTSLGSITDDHIFNSVMEGKKPKDITYNLGFDSVKRSVAKGGLYIGDLGLNEDYYPKIDDSTLWINFAESSTIKSILYNPDNKKLIRASIRLSF